ncbi:tRNA (uracil-5-)-methyltransferase homolog A isoform X1 [Polistes fuscatus]|uniref:tRNA (uracil-5-)-methyltransferase homolog A isoform X1 n=1 Tax=Polistes fuscatus TaxID=30207 RepID=UPI001CA9F419|nr:tRNA (uracil-5-)-methyltransferase homolog A isoform X1 [Polistes fuscatus]
MTDSETKQAPAEDTKEKNENNPYAYLERENFTSEKFKVEVRGLPKYYGIGEFKKLLNEKLDLKPCKIKSPKRPNGWLYVCFRSEECRTQAISTLNGILWKNCKLTAQIAKPAPDPFIKRKLEEENKTNKKLKTDIDSSMSAMDRVKLTTTPLWNMSYPDQLEFKQGEMRSVLIKFGQQMLDNYTKQNGCQDLSEWLSSQKKLYEGLPCELKPILHAESTEAYRNKCEFTIGKNIKGDKVIIGFRLSSYAAGCTAVGPIDNLCHIPTSMKTAVKILEEFVQISGLEPFNPVDNSGYWRQVTARTSRLDQLMLIVGINPQDLSDEKLQELQKMLKEFFEVGKGSSINVTSLYFQTMRKKSAGSESGNTIQHISGAEYIEEILLDKKFRISPQAFFQVNTLGAEVLYKAIIDMAEPTNDTTILDICSGTGTIGLSFSEHCGEVLGVEVVPDAIKDAKQNALQNGVTNSDFFVGKAEDILLPIVQRATKSRIVAVLDPPRAGIHQKTLLMLRRTNNLNRLIYISCDPQAAMKNLLDLSRPRSKLFVGKPFVPIKAVPVDMFPHTKHCELIICFERFSKVTNSNVDA